MRAPDLVRDSKLKTQYHDGITRHVITTSDRRHGHRRIKQDQRWQRGEILGEGAFGVVWKETLVAGESDVRLRAVKRIRKRAANTSTVDYSRELEAIAKFSRGKYRSFFVESYGWFADKDHVFITMEYCEHGDLQEYMSKFGKMPEEDVRAICYQILEGVYEMHDNGFAHRDLKPSNVLIKRTKEHKEGWWVKIGDFGISKRAEEGMTALRTVSGTEGFLAPEVLVRKGSLFLDQAMLPKLLKNKHEYTFVVDIWALGEIAYRAICGTAPFSANLVAYVYGKAKFPTAALEELKISNEGVDFIQQLMQVFPSERLSALEALQHDWFEELRDNASISSSEFQSVDENLELPSDLLLPLSGTGTSGSSIQDISESAPWTDVDGTSTLRTLNSPPTVSRSTPTIVARQVDNPAKAEVAASSKKSPFQAYVEDDSDASEMSSTAVDLTAAHGEPGHQPAKQKPVQKPPEKDEALSEDERSATTSQKEEDTSEGEEGYAIDKNGNYILDESGLRVPFRARVNRLPEPAATVPKDVPILGEAFQKGNKRDRPNPKQSETEHRKHDVSTADTGSSLGAKGKEALLGGTRSFHFSTGGGPDGFKFTNAENIFAEFLKGSGYQKDDDRVSELGYSERHGPQSDKASEARAEARRRQEARRPKKAETETLKHHYDNASRSSSSSAKQTRYYYSPSGGGASVAPEIIEAANGHRTVLREPVRQRDRSPSPLARPPLGQRRRSPSPMTRPPITRAEYAPVPSSSSRKTRRTRKIDGTEAEPRTKKQEAPSRTSRFLQAAGFAPPSALKKKNDGASRNEKKTGHIGAQRKVHFEPDDASDSSSTWSTFVDAHIDPLEAEFGGSGSESKRENGNPPPLSQRGPSRSTPYDYAPGPPYERNDFNSTRPYETYNPHPPQYKPTYAKVSRDYLDIATLHYYDIPYEIDRTDPEYIIVMREMEPRETEILFEHTRRLRSRQNRNRENARLPHVYQPEEVVYSRKIGPEDVSWAPRSSEKDRGREYAKPSLSRNATYVY